MTKTKQEPSDQTPVQEVITNEMPAGDKWKQGTIETRFAFTGEATCTYVLKNRKTGKYVRFCTAGGRIETSDRRLATRFDSLMWAQSHLGHVTSAGVDSHKVVRVVKKDAANWKAQMWTWSAKKPETEKATSSG